MPNGKNSHDHEKQKEDAVKKAHERLAAANQQHARNARADMTRAGMMPSQQRAKELDPFRDPVKSKKLKDDNVDLQNLLNGFVTAISPIAPAISQILRLQSHVLKDRQRTSLIDIGETFAKLPFAIAKGDRSMQEDLDMFIGAIKKLTQFVAENPEIIVGVASILFPAIAPVSGFLTAALGFILSSALEPELKNPLLRAATRAKNEVDQAESAIGVASHYAGPRPSPVRY